MHKILSMNIQQNYNKIQTYRSRINSKAKSDSAILAHLAYLKVRGELSHIRKGVYLPSDMQDKFRIACNSVDDACLVYHGALEYYMLQTQEFNWLYVHSSSAFRTFNYMNQSYIYKPVKFLYKPVVIDSGSSFPIRVTSLSQTIIDCLYNINLAGGIEELLYALAEIKAESINEMDMIHCLEYYDNKSLYQRTGFILEQFKERLDLSDSFFELCHEKIGKNISYLINPYYCNSFSKKWNLCIPDNLQKQTKTELTYAI